MMGKKWIQDALKNHPEGTFHKALHVPQGKPIPEKVLEKAEHSSHLKTRRRAHLVENLHKINHNRIRT